MTERSGLGKHDHEDHDATAGEKDGDEGGQVSCVENAQQRHAVRGGLRGLCETREADDEQRSESHPAHVTDDADHDAEPSDVVPGRGARRAALRVQRVQIVKLLEYSSLTFTGS